MLDPHRLTQLAEAVADGETPDWALAGHEADDDALRAIIAELRAVASIAELFATITGTASHGQRMPREILPPGATWGMLRIINHVGKGRHGDVYRAWDPSLDREVALKLVRGAPTEATDPQIVHEGRLMARVHHPNVIAIFGAQRIGDVTGLWMEFVHGRTLAEELSQQGPFVAGALIKVGVELCSALGAVHEAGLVHRDVKTRNALRDARGRIVLGDFGIGRELRDGDDGRNDFAGTPAYLAPEIFARLRATPQSDIYSLGAVLFELATGRYPVEGRSVRALRDAHERGERTLLASIRPDLPAGLTAVIDRALESDPARRFRSAKEMASALEQRVPRLLSSRRIAAIAALMIAAVTILAVAGARWRGSESAAIPFAARDFVLTTAFENRTGEPLLDGTLEVALERELSASTFVNVVPRSRVQDTLALMRKPADARVDGVVGREVAIRDGKIRAVITGRVEKIGTRYSISTDIVAVNGRPVASLREVAGPDDLVDAVDRIARSMRERLGESLSSIEATATRLPKVSTASLRALQLYQQALVISGEEGGAGMANPRAVAHLLQEALREDRQFVMAHILMAHAMLVSGRHDEVRKYADLAAAAAEHGTSLDRAVARAEWHGLHAFLTVGAERRQHQEGAAAAFEVALGLESDHEWSLGCLTNVYPDLGRRADAVRVSERLLELRPNSLTVLWRAARAALANGQLDVARRYADRAAALELPIDQRTAYQAAWVRLFSAHHASWQRQPQEAAQIAEENRALLRTLPAPAQPPFAIQLIDLYLRLGQLRRAEELVSFADTPQGHRFTLMRVLKERQNPKAMIAAIRHLYEDTVSASSITGVLIDAGELRRAHRALDSFKGRPVTPRYLRLVRGKLALAEGRPREAVRVLTRPAEGPEPWRGTFQWADTVLALAAAHAANGDIDDAIAQLEDATHNWFEYPDNSAYVYLRVRDRLAQFYREAGRSSEAERVDAELTTLLAVADEDHPVKRRLKSGTLRRGNVAPHP